MAHFITDTCIGCTLCRDICPTEAITGDQKELHFIHEEKCIDCGACGSVCPVACIYDQHGEISPKRKMAELPKAVVIEDHCTGCEFCVDVCPYKCISLVGGATVPGVLPVAEVDPAKCVGCGLCVAVCDKDAIEVETKEGERIDQDFLKIYNLNEYNR